MKSDPLKDKIDELALDILANVKVQTATPQSVLDALDVVKVLGQWVAIKNKVPTGDEEGSGINEYQERLSGQAAAGGSGGGTADQSAGDAAEPEPDSGDLDQGTGSGTAKRTYKQARKGNGDFASGRGDPDNGGPELTRFMASLPGNAGSAPRDQHDPRGKSRPVRGNSNSGSASLEDAGESDLDELVG